MKYSKVQMSNQNNIEFKKEATNCNEEPTNKPFDKSFRQPIRLVRQNLSNHGLLNLTIPQISINTPPGHSQTHNYTNLCLNTASASSLGAIGTPNAAGHLQITPGTALFNQTPTPTSLLTSCENNGLFKELELRQAKAQAQKLQVQVQQAHAHAQAQAQAQAKMKYVSPSAITVGLLGIQNLQNAAKLSAGIYPTNAASQHLNVQAQSATNPCNNISLGKASSGPATGNGVGPIGHGLGITSGNSSAASLLQSSPFLTVNPSLHPNPFDFKMKKEDTCQIGNSVGSSIMDSSSLMVSQPKAVVSEEPTSLNNLLVPKAQSEQRAQRPEEILKDLLNNKRPLTRQSSNTSIEIDESPEPPSDSISRRASLQGGIADDTSSVDVETTSNLNHVITHPQVSGPAVSGLTEESSLSKPPGKKRGRKRAEESEHDAQAKRQKFLERNRKAAARCREKKKKWIVDLEAHHKDLKIKFSDLHNENLILRQNCVNSEKQIKTLKNMYFAATGTKVDDSVLSSRDESIVNAAAQKIVEEPLAALSTVSAMVNNSVNSD